MLLDHHVDELRRSGLTDETIRAAGIRSEVEPIKLATILDWKKYPPKCCPAMVFPFVGDGGRNGYARVKPDRPRTSGGKPVKYESPRGQPNQVYLPPGVADVLADPTRELLITEGEKKSLCVAQHGFPGIGLVGVFGWKEKARESLLPALERIPWKDRSVYIVFDSDIATNEDVQSAESRLAAMLQNRGARVRVCRISAGPGGAKQGIDDYVVAQNAAGVDPKRTIRGLLDVAEEPTPPSAIETKQPANDIDAVPEAMRFLATTEMDGLPRLRFWRGSFFYWARGAYAELPTAESRGALVDHLDKSFFKITSSAVSNVLEGLRAKAMLPGRTEPPAWIGNKSGPWSADEILAARNGLVHIPSLVAGKDCTTPPTPRFFTTNALDYNFEFDAPPPENWLTFLSQLWPEDSGSIDTLQEWMGYTLTPDTRQQKIMLIVGPKRSGKGTIARVIRSLIGEANCCGPTLASLAQNFGLQPMLGKSAAIISDARLGGRTDSQVVVERLLSISGEDALSIDRKFLEPVTAKLSARLMVFSNELPRLGDSSGALAGRMIVLRLTESFYGREDHDLGAKLQTELPGILLWAIAGWQRLRQRGRFVQPESGGELMGDLEDLNSPVGQFLREECVIGNDCRVSRGDLYDAYARWCNAHGRRHVDDQVGFGRQLRAAVPTIRDSQPRVDGRCVRHYEGVSLRTGW